MTGPIIRVTFGVCVPGSSCLTFDRAGCCEALLPLVWANAPEPISATKTPKMQSTEAIKTRSLKKADFEVDFFFMDGSGVVSLSGKPETVAGMLGELLKACQQFFSHFVLATNYADRAVGMSKNHVR